MLYLGTILGNHSKNGSTLYITKLNPVLQIMDGHPNPSLLTKASDRLSVKCFAVPVSSRNFSSWSA